jgi:hypothetical protein
VAWDLLPHAHRVQLGQLLSITLDQLGESEHVHRSLVGGQRAPLRKGGLGGIDGEVNIFLGRLVDRAYFLVVKRVGEFECLAGFGLDKLSDFVSSESPSGFVAVRDTSLLMNSRVSIDSDFIA